MAEKQTKPKAKKKAPVRKKDKSDDLSQQLEALTEQLNQEKDKYLRLFAEFENFKKRTSKERIALFKTAGQEVISSLLPVVDDFDRAVSQCDDKELGEDIKGFVLIKNKLTDTLKSNGLTPTATQPGDEFDAEIHEAITLIPAPKPAQKGKIIEVIEKGYQLGEKIIRFPKVVVGQ